jgi:hypothetical protein
MPKILIEERGILFFNGARSSQRLKQFLGLRERRGGDLAVDLAGNAVLAHDGAVDS